jgi:hypothetical protein
MASFFFSSNPLSKRVEAHEAMRDGLIEQMGVGEKDLRQASAFLNLHGHTERTSEARGDRNPTEFVKGEEFRVAEVERDGDKNFIRCYRMNGRQMEQVTLVEERAAPKTLVLADRRGVR